MKRTAFFLCGLAALILGVISIACSNDSRNPAKATGDFRVMSTDITSCKTETRSADENEDDEYVHVLEYEAKSDGTLHLRDVNRVVSCSSQGIEVEAKLEGNVIFINEHEISDDIASTCVCPVDFDMVVGPLEDGDYILNYCVDGRKQASFRFHYESLLKGLQTVTPQESKPFEIDGLFYSIVSDFPAKVCVTTKWGFDENNNAYSEYSGDYIIPEQITYEGTIYKVTSIGMAAFWKGHGVTSVSIPSSVTSIYPLAFAQTIITSIDIPESVVNLGFSAFQGCHHLESINLPTTLESIGSSVFNNCSMLTFVKLPEGPRDLFEEIFKGCTNLKSVVIPDSTVCIGREAFAGCSSLESIILPSKVKLLDPDAFQGCSSLSKIYSLNPIPPERSLRKIEIFDDSVLQNATLYVPKGCKEAYSTADYWNRFVHIEEIDE